MKPNLLGCILLLPFPVRVRHDFLLKHGNPLSSSVDHFFLVGGFSTAVVGILSLLEPAEKSFLRAKQILERGVVAPVAGTGATVFTVDTDPLFGGRFTLAPRFELAF